MISLDWFMPIWNCQFLTLKPQPKVDMIYSYFFSCDSSSICDNVRLSLCLQRVLYVTLCYSSVSILRFQNFESQSRTWDQVRQSLCIALESVNPVSQITAFLFRQIFVQRYSNISILGMNEYIHISIQTKFKVSNKFVFVFVQYGYFEYIQYSYSL